MTDLDPGLHICWEGHLPSLALLAAPKSIPKSSASELQDFQPHKKSVLGNMETLDGACSPLKNSLLVQILTHQRENPAPSTETTSHILPTVSPLPICF